ncbi:MAG: hypothetical protein ACJASF_001630 [Vicingaceae bacterium]|jgi:hypothetical protein
MKTPKFIHQKSSVDILTAFYRFIEYKSVNLFLGRLNKSNERIAFKEMNGINKTALAAFCCGNPILGSPTKKRNPATQTKKAFNRKIEGFFVNYELKYTSKSSKILTINPTLRNSLRSNFYNY